MQYRTLGKTGLRVSAVGFGGIPIQRIDAAGTRVLMERLAEKGVNFIDTARGYTVSESYLGEALSGGLRDRFFLATKSMARDYDGMTRDIERSLANLQTDHIDLYQLHNIKSDADFALAFSARARCATSARRRIRRTASSGCWTIRRSRRSCSLTTSSKTRARR